MDRALTLPVITSEDISRDPDQAAYKLNMTIDALSSEVVDRENGDSEGSDALKEEREARIEADGVLQQNITDEETERILVDGDLQDQITTLSNSELKLTLTTVDPGAGSALAANTLLGVYV